MEEVGNPAAREQILLFHVDFQGNRESETTFVRKKKDAPGLHSVQGQSEVPSLVLISENLGLR